MRETSKFGSKLARGFKKATAGTLAALMVVTALPTSGLAGAFEVKAAEETTSVYVLYDAARGEHFLTADASEKDGLLNIGWKEGNEAWVAPKKSNTPVYCLYNPNNGGDHYYTSNASEKDALLAAGWQEGNVKFYSDDAKGVLINTLYNPNEIVRNHHYTASTSEKDGLVAQGWQDHTNKDTAIYGVDVNAAVAIESVTLSNTTPKVGDTITATTTPSNIKDVTFQWYADSDKIDGATKDSYTVTEDEIGKAIKVAATAGDKTVESKPTNTVQKATEAAAEITLTDASGLQTNGTGLVGDRLRVSYGSDLGMPDTITWYYNDTVVKAYNRQAGVLTTGLYLATGTTAEAVNDKTSNCKDGNYYVVIINTEGKVFTSNSLSLVYDEQLAVIKSFDIEDDLDNAYNIDYDDEDGLAVVTVVMSKAYEGDFYIYEDDAVSYTNTNKKDKVSFDPDDIGVAGAAAANGSWTNLTASKKLSNKDVIEVRKGNPVEGTAATAATNKGQVYVAEDGEITIKWLSSFEFERGKKYKLAFDQKEIKSDDISASARKDITLTKSVEAKYLTAPTAIVLNTTTVGTKAKATLVDKDGNTLEYYGAGTKKAGATVGFDGFDYIRVFGNDSAKEDGAEKKAENGTIDKGVWESAAGLGDAKYFYVEAKTKDGVFAEKSVKIKSAFKAANVAVADTKGFEWSENGDNPAQADIDLSGVVAPATVYIYTTEDEHYTNGGDFDIDDTNSYRGKVAVKAGQGSATISNVFKKDDVGKIFTAVLVADDEETYGRVTTGVDDDGDITNVKVLKQVATTMEYDEAAYTANGYGRARLLNTDGTLVIDQLPIKLKDQFGEDLDLVTTKKGPNDDSAQPIFSDVSKKAIKVDGVNDGGDCAEGGSGVYSIDNTGALSIAIASSDGYDADDGLDITLLGSTLKVRTDIATAKNTNHNSALTVKLGSDKLVQGGLGIASGVVTVTSKEEFAWAAGSSDVTTIKLNGALNLTNDVTLPAGKVVDLENAGNTDCHVLTVGGTLTMKGTFGGSADKAAGDVIGTGKIVLAGTSANNQTNLTFLATTANAATDIEIATATTLTANTVMANTGDFTVAKGATFDTATFNFTSAKAFVNKGTATFGAGTITLDSLDNAGTFTGANVTVTNGVLNSAALTVANITIGDDSNFSNGTINVTGKLTMSNAKAIVIDPTKVTITKLIVACPAAGESVIIGDGTNAYTFTQNATGQAAVDHDIDATDATLKVKAVDITVTINGAKTFVHVVRANEA